MPGLILSGPAKERADSFRNEVNEVAAKRVRLYAKEAELKVQMKSRHTELLAKQQVGKKLWVRATNSHKGERSKGLTRLEELHGAADTTKPDWK